jgi:hypothetical protein
MIVAPKMHPKSKNFNENDISYLGFKKEYYLSILHP